MSRVAKIAGLGLGILIFLLLLAVAWVKLVVDAAWLEGKIAAAVGQREVKVEAFDLGLLPPAVELQGVSMGNPEGFAEGQLLSLGSAELRLSLFSLLSGPLVVETVQAVDLQVNLVRDRQGRENWKMPREATETQQPAQEPSGPRQIPKVLVRHANISNLSFHWQDLRNDKAMRVSALNAVWDPELADYPLQANWDFAVEPEVVSAAAMLRSKASLEGGVVRLDQFQITADMSSKHLPEGSGEFTLEASAELDFGSGEMELSELTLSAPGVSMQANASINNEQALASMSLEVQQLRQVMAMSGLSSILDEPMVSQRLSGALSLKVPELKMENGGQALSLSGFSASGAGVELTADVTVSGLEQQALPKAAKAQVNGRVEDVSPFLALAATLSDGDDGERWRRLADEYKAERRRAASVDLDLELEDGNLVVRNTEIYAMGAKAMADRLQVEVGSKDSNGTLELSVQEIDRLLGAWLGPGAEWVKRFAGLMLKADLSQDNQKLELNLDMLDRLSVPRRFTLKAPVKLDLAANRMQVPQASLQGPGMHLGATMDLQLADMTGAANLEIIEANPRSVIDLFADIKHADQNLLRHLGGKVQLELTNSGFALAIREAKLDDTSITGDISSTDGATEFSVALGKLELDPYIPAGKKNKPPTQTETTSDDAPVLSADAIDSISGLNLKGQLAVEELTVKKAKIPQLTLEVTALEGKLDASMRSDALYQGAFNAAIAINAAAEPATIAARAEASKIALQDLLADMVGKDFVQGSMDLAANIDSENGTMQQLLEKTNGTASLNIGEGSLPYMDLAGKLKSITDISQLLAIGSDDGNGTQFTSMSATVKIENGTARNEDFTMKSPAIEASGSGQYDLPNNNLDYTAILGVTGGEWTISLPVNITGAPPEIKYGLDTSQIGADDLAKILPSMVFGTAGGILDKVLDIGGSQEEQQQEEEDNTTTEGEPEQLKEKAVDAIKDLLPF